MELKSFQQVRNIVSNIQVYWKDNGTDNHIVQCMKILRIDCVCERRHAKPRCFFQKVYIFHKPEFEKAKLACQL